MTEAESRIAELTRRGVLEREALFESMLDLSDEVARRRTQLKVTGIVAGTVAAAGAVAFKLFGRSSPAARIGRAASAASIGLGLVRAFVRLSKFL